MILLLDYISAIPISFSLVLIYDFLINYNIKNLVFLIWMFILSILVTYLKHINYPNWFLSYIRRPKGACNTDLLSKNGKCKNLNTGFPSGHMALTAFFASYIIVRAIYYNENYIQIRNKIIVFTILLVLMGLSRYYKNVHTIFQIISGFLLGIVFALLTFHINKKIDKNVI